MRTRLARTAAAATLLLVAGCASADPVATLDPPAGEASEVSSQVTTLTTLLTEIYAHQLDAEQETTIVSADATVAVAVTELTQALSLGEGARDFAAATAFEAGRSDGDSVTDVEVVASDPQLVGSRHGHTVATVRVVISTSHTSGPTTEQNVTFALTLDGDRLDDVGAWAPGVDSGVGLASPTGAAQRFLDLVHAGELDAVRYFSDGVNTDAQLQVLTAATAGDVSLTEVPQAQFGSVHVVYALDPGGAVLARFDVLLGSQTRVVFTPTA